MLSGVTGGAQRNRVAITRLDPNATIGSRTHMRSFRWCRFAAGYAGKLTDKGQVLRPPKQVRLRLAGRYAAGIRGWALASRIVGASVFTPICRRICTP
jgi:hypothetical protein